MSGHLLTDSEISRLLDSAKHVLNPRAREKTQGKCICRNFELSDVSGNRFGIFIRSHTEMPDNYSAGLMWIPPSGLGVILMRCNGPSHKHKNHVEGDTFRGVCHIHIATERYLSRGKDSQGYAEQTDAYTTVHGATHELVRRCNVSGLSTAADEPDLFGPAQ